MSTSSIFPGMSKLVTDIRKLREVAGDTGRSRQANGYALNTRSAIEMVRLEASIIERIGTLSAIATGARPVTPRAAADAQRSKLQQAIDDCTAARTAAAVSATNGPPKE